MKKSKKIHNQLLMAMAMFAIFIFMTLSYHSMVETGSADKMNTIAYYFWFVSIGGWLIKILYDLRRTVLLKNSHN